jgi:hypothetical protein
VPRWLSWVDVDIPDAGAVYLLVAAAGFASYLHLKLRDPRRRARRVIRALPATAIADVEDGARVRVTGIVSAHREPTTAPVSGRPCIGFRLVVDQTTNAGSEPVLIREHCDAFWIADGSGRALVEGPLLFGVEPDEAWSNLPPSLNRMLEEAEVPLRGSFDTYREFQYTEAILASGDRVSVVGRASVTIDPAGESHGHRRPPTLRRIVGQRREPAMVADADEPDGGPPR